jgi:hypothetical protein
LPSCPELCLSAPIGAHDTSTHEQDKASRARHDRRVN